MIQVHKDFSLKNFNTFCIDAKCRQFIRLNNEENISEFISRGIPKHYFILGEGSNILFKSDYRGTIIFPEVTGIEILKRDNLNAEIVVGSRENWDNFVAFCCRNNLGGIENLSLIPGTVGAAAVQNIGAYGVEAGERILWVEGIHLEKNEKIRLYKQECKFEYRNSIFKNELKDKFIITRVVFSLDVNPRFVLNYGNVEVLFKKKKEQDISALRETIIEIRKSKLPDPDLRGNAGSFFKNPVISPHRFSTIRDKYPSVPSYPSGNNIKIPAAWLIEKAGLKGIREGDAGTWPDQPLVIVNYGNASGKDIFRLSEKIRSAVNALFKIDLEREVRII